MYKIVKDGKVLAYTDNVRYIKKHANGCYVPCEPAEAQGIALNSVPYNLPGHTEIDGEEAIPVLMTDTETTEVVESLNILLGVTP